MEQAARDAEQLQAALEAGSGIGLPHADESPGDLAEMLGVADQLRAAASGHAGDPRPSFVLGLEEQLRTDFRLQPPEPPATPARPRWSGSRITLTVLVLALALVLTAGFLVERAAPGDSLWGTHRLLEQVRLAASVSAGSRVDQLLDIGWRHVRTLSDLAERHVLTARSLDALLPAITDSYSEAIRLAASNGDDRLRLRVAREAGDAADELRRLVGQLPPDDGPPLVAAETVLRAMILRVDARLAAGGAAVVPTATPLPATVAASATAGAGNPGFPTDTPPPLRLSTATLAPTATLPPPPTRATTQPPTATPTERPLPSPEATRRERLRTPTLPPPQPSDSPTTPLPVATGTIAPPTPTQDKWLTAPAPPSEPPGAPSETPVAQP